MTQDKLDFATGLQTRLLTELTKVIKGKTPFLKRLVTALIAGSHVLIEDVPGLGKTTAAKALAKVVHDPLKPLVFRRIQFTPDLLPYDITGVDVFNPELRQFEFRPGPIFGHIVLADEINRTTPKVQSALLEVMEEGQVTVGQTTHKMDALFFVLATQNPIEMEGTYPLPAAQLDRFLMKLRVGYPDETEEKAIYSGDPSHHQLPNLQAVVGVSEILQVREWAEQVHCAPELLDLLMAVVKATREHKAVQLGVSPRGGLLCLKALRVWALLHGRNYLIDQDLADLVPDILSHRLQLKNPKLSSETVLKEILTHELAQIQK